MRKKTIVYLNPDCFTDTDCTILHHLTKEFHVIWFYIYEINKKMRLTIEQARTYSDKYGIDLHLVISKYRLRDPRNLKIFANVIKEINRINPSLIYHSFVSPYWLLLLKTHCNCKKVVLGVHDVKMHSLNLNSSILLMKYTLDYSIKCHKYHITLSKSQHDLLLASYGIESAMVGMSYKYYGSSQLKIPHISNGVKLLFFGSINLYKGLDILIEALEKLHTQGINNLSLTIAGKGDYWDKCKSFIRTHEMYNLQIRFIENSEIPDLMSSHHFLALPYRDATQSGPLATAIAYELPILAPRFGYFMETYTDDSAILYEQGNIEDALLHISSLSSEQYANLKNNCKKVKEMNTEECVAKRYIDYFKQVIDKQ